MRRFTRSVVTRGFSSEVNFSKGARFVNYSGHGEDFDLDMGEMMGPAHNTKEAELPIALQSYIPNFVTVGHGVGFVIRSDRDTINNGIMRHDLLIATATSCILSTDPRKEPVCMAADGTPIDIAHVYMQKRATEQDSYYTGGKVPDEGLAFLVPSEKGARQLGTIATPTIQSRMKVMDHMFVPMYDRGIDDFVLNQCTIDVLKPVPVASAFMPNPYKKEFAGSPVFVQSIRGSAGGSLTGKQSLLRNSLSLAGVVSGFHHEDPYNPRINIASMLSGLFYQMAVGTFQGSRWKVHFQYKSDTRG